VTGLIRRRTAVFSREQFAWHSAAGVRPGNEDSCGYQIAPDRHSALLVLADGMGGHVSGEVASRLTTRLLLQQFIDQAGFADAAAGLLEMIRQAHERIAREAAQDARKQGMGTTVVAALLRDSELTVAHVGDSRALLFRPPYVYRLTQDHLHVVDALGVPENRAKQHPQGNVLSQALGTQGAVDPDLHRCELRSGDYLVLCSDGVSECLSEVEMCRLLTCRSVRKAARQMVEAALRQGSRDNCSVIAAAIR
jgi:protein phosphatase